MNVLTWIAIASLHKINQQENENLKASCGAIHLKVPEPELPHFMSTGNPVPPNKYPFIAGFDTLANYRSKKRCTGVLISKRHVLTAAHCVYDNSQVILPGPYCNPHGKLLPTLDMTIYLGTKCPKPGDCPNGEERTPYKPRYIIPHPKYEPCRGHINDIALIELDIEAKPEEASPICMPEEDDSMLYQTVTAIGYGTDTRIRPDRREPGLQEVNMTAIGIYGGKIISSGRKSAVCPGDSGGPLIRVPESRNATLFGILSTTSVNCSLYFQGDWDSIGTSTDVRPHLNWICDITGVCPSQASTAYPSPVSGDEVLAMKQRRMGWEDWFQGMGGVFIPTNDMSN